MINTAEEEGPRWEQCGAAAFWWEAATDLLSHDVEPEDSQPFLSVTDVVFPAAGAEGALAAQILPM